MGEGKGNSPLPPPPPPKARPGIERVRGWVAPNPALSHPARTSVQTLEVREARTLGPSWPTSQVPTTQLSAIPPGLKVNSRGLWCWATGRRRPQQGRVGVGEGEGGPKGASCRTRGLGVGGGGRGRSGSGADLFTSKRLWAFQTSQQSTRGDGYCLQGGPTNKPLVCWGKGGGEAGAQEAPRWSTNLHRSLAPQCH